MHAKDLNTDVHTVQLLVVLWATKLSLKYFEKIADWIYNYNKILETQLNTIFTHLKSSYLVELL